MPDRLTAASAVIDDVDLDELVRDPHLFYARCRRDRPIGFMPLLDGWLVTRWDDCEALGRDDDRFDAYSDFAVDFLGHNLLSMSGEPHRQLRAAAENPLRPKAVGRYVETLTRPAIRSFLADVRARGRAEAMSELLERASVRVVGDMFGMLDVDDATRLRWFRDLFEVDQLTAADSPGARLAAQTRDEVDAYFRDAVERVSTTPDDSGLSALVNDVEDGQGPRTFDELRGTILLFVMGGFREPGHGGGATLLGLLENPEQARAVVADPTLIPAAIHEGLRWIPPFGTTFRRALVNVEIHDVVIPAGASVHLSLTSAGRDEHRYENPDQFDLSRPRLPVAAFGFGRHYCAGHFLARQIERIVLEEMFATLPGLRLDPDAEPVVTGFESRGVASLPVVWDA